MARLRRKREREREKEREKDKWRGDVLGELAYELHVEEDRRGLCAVH